MRKEIITLPNEKYEIRVTKSFVTCYWNGHYISTHFTKEEALEWLKDYDKHLNFLL